MKYAMCGVIIFLALLTGVEICIERCKNEQIFRSSFIFNIGMIVMYAIGLMFI